MDVFVLTLGKIYFVLAKSRDFKKKSKAIYVCLLSKKSLFLKIMIFN